MQNFNKKLQAKFDEMCKSGKLFRVNLTGQEIWDLYLKSFTRETDPIFRDPASSSHNCNHCNNFIRRYGNIVSIDANYKITTIFDVECDEEFKNTAAALTKAIGSAQISEVFFETFNELNKLPYESCTKSNSVFKLGTDKNHKRYTKEEAEKYGVVKPDEIRTFNHIHLFLPKEFMDTTGHTIESIMGVFRDAKNVFQRAMEEISLDTLKLVQDLIKQGSLLNGEAHLFKIEQIIPLKKQYDGLSDSQKDNWCWINSYKLPFAKFKNELVGVLCSELSEGEDLNKAVTSWNKRVDPVNYMKATAPITKKQIEEAKEFVEGNGFTESFERRFASIDDIKVSEILHSNVGEQKIKSVSVFDGVKATSTRHKRSEFEGIEQVGIEKFMSDILPGCTSIEAYFKNAHEGNLVSLTTANNPDSKPIFKWPNNYSWTFNGNLAGKSEIRDAVKSRGGNVDGVVRVSLSFPNTTDDYDLHLREPNGVTISFNDLRSRFPSSGMLDLDAQGRDGHQPPEKRVENIIYTDKGLMPKGDYKIFVHNYSRRGMHTSFMMEIELEGDATILELNGKLTGDTAEVGTISYDGKEFILTPSKYMNIRESKTISKEVYGLETNQFHKVNLVCLSPNHWNGSNVGNKHYFFMLDKCKSPASIRSFHNENLVAELLAHRKVMEVLGATNNIDSTDKQLSGLGFNATVRDELIVKLQGTHKRMIKILF